MFHYECPWPSAQAEVSAVAAYKTPRDKLQCVFRCATTIMNLLSMACERGVPAADDFVPVLVYVLIKVLVTLTDIFTFMVPCIINHKIE
jgi:hypothetical protein